MAAFSATDETDVGIIGIECVSVKGNILPAEFGMVYSFQVANFSIFFSFIRFLPYFYYSGFEREKI